MVQIISPSPRAMQAGQIGQALGMGIGVRQQQQQQRAQQELQKQLQQQQQSQLAQLLFGEQGQQFSGLPLEAQLKAAQLQQQLSIAQQQQMAKQEEMQQKLGLEQAKVAEKQQAEQQKIAQKIEPLQGAFQTVQRMRDISAKGRLGRGSAIKGFFGGETAKDREEYEQLGKSLISFATNIPIRNRIEFETLANKLYDPSLPDKAREGVLDAMERIIKNSLAQYAGPKNAENFLQGTPQTKQQERPSLESFFEK